MKHARMFAAGALALAVVGGGISAAAVTGGSSSKAAAAPTSTTTVHVATATVNGMNEQVLVDAHSMPLYTYAGDSPTRSAVTGGLAALWPPVTADSPTETGATGKLTVIHDSNGAQVQYNGHFLYTFVEDRPDHVTGQGVQNFFVATPGSAATPVPAATPGPPAPVGQPASGVYGSSGSSASSGY